MHLDSPKIHRPTLGRRGTLLAVLASALCGNALYGSGLNLSTTTAAGITCNTATGPATPATITVKPGADTNYPTVVTLGTLPAGLVVTPSSGTLNSGNASTGVVFTLSAAQGCAGMSAGANSGTFTFKANQNGAGAVADTNTVSTTITVTAAASGLSASLSASTITCVLSGGVYTPSPSSIVMTVANAATGGTPFTMTKPTWLTLVTQPPYTATSSTVSSAISFTPICGGPAGTVNQSSIVLTNAPAPAVSVSVTMKVVAPATLTTSTPATQTYVKGSGSARYPTWSVTLGGAATGQIYSVVPTSLGSWLTANPMTGAYGTSNTITFQATGGVDALPASSAPYSQTVHISVQGYSDTTVTIPLLVTNPASTLSFAEGNVRNLTWVQGQGIPSAIVTAVSSNAPIQYATSTSGAIAPIIAASEASGLAYSFGTQIPVTFPNLPFSEAQPGAVLSGSITFAWGSTTSVVTFNVTVQAGAPTSVLTSASPLNLPTASTGEQFTLTLYGSGFIPSSDPTQRTTIGILNTSGLIAQDANILSANVINASTIVLTIAAPAASTDPLLPWTGTSVTFGVCNPAGGSCTNPTGTFSIMVGAGPTISSIVSASTQTSASTPNIAPYDILTIWGSNFCTANGTGCGANGVLYGQLNPATQTYPTSLSPDGGQRNLTVSFKAHSASPSTYVAAPLLYATNSQINLVVPANNFPASGALDVLVGFGGLSSNVFAATAVATDPGIFTIDPYGQAAVLNPNYTIANGQNPAVMGSVVSIYATGLGSPTSLTSGNPVTYNSATCITPTNYETIAGATALDGTLLQSTLLGGNLPPCFGTANAPSAITAGGQSSTIGYTGFVADAVAGLYQSNSTLHAATSPTTPSYFVDAAGTHLTAITTPVQLPISLTSNSVPTQAPGSNLGVNPGATIWVVAPALSLTQLSAQSVTSAAGSWTPQITASGGTAPYTFTVDGSGSSPATGGLTFTVSSPTLSFVLAPSSTGVYVIRVAATDANGVTGSTTFTLTVTDVGDNSTVTAAASAVTASVSGTANSAVTTITAGGGTGPYTYAVAPSAVLAVSSSGVVSLSGTAQAGTYHADVTVTDSNSKTRDIHFNVPVAMTLTATNNATTLTGIANLQSTQALTTIGNTGGGTVNYTLIQPDTSKCTMTIPSGVLTVPSSGCVAGTYSVTVVGTDSAPTNGATGAVATLNLSVHLN